MSVVITIPVYRPKPLPYEIFTLHRAVDLFGNYELVFVCATGFERSPYKSVAPNASWEEFDASYFASTRTYNKLCLSSEFYLRFKRHESLLIYQLDAMALAGNLDWWSQQQLDYVGGAVAWRDPRNGDFVRWTRSQNGGLSLRDIEAHLRVLSCLTRVGGAVMAVHQREMHREMGGYSADQQKSALWNARFALRTVVEQMRMRRRSFDIPGYLATSPTEDQFWSRIAQVFDANFRVASLEEAQGFSIQNGFDLTASKLIESPPFGCHGPAITETLFQFACRERTPLTTSEINLWRIAHRVGLVPALDLQEIEAGQTKQTDRPVKNANSSALQAAWQ